MMKEYRDRQGRVWSLVRTQGEIAYLFRINEHRRSVNRAIPIDVLLSEYETV